MKLRQIIRSLGAALFVGSAIGAFAVFREARSLETLLNGEQEKIWYGDGDAYLAPDTSESASAITGLDGLHLHDSYYVVADSRVVLGLAVTGVVSVCLISFAAPLGRFMARRMTGI